MPKRKDNPIASGKTLKQTFHKIGLFYMANKYIKRYSILLIIREMPMKTKTNHFYIPIRITK